METYNLNGSPYNLTLTNCIVNIRGIATNVKIADSRIFNTGILNCQNDKGEEKIVYRDRIVEKKVVEKVPTDKALKEIKGLKEQIVLLEKENARLKDNADLWKANERIEALLYANHEAAERIRELEAGRSEVAEIECLPSRDQMIAMCKERDWWLGDGVITDDDETLRYPWIDFRDEFRHIRTADVIEQIKKCNNKRYKKELRERYRTDEKFRERCLELQQKRREKLKENK